ncbi:AMP-binding protein [Actinomadura barringtoniae]|uniref:AMP-binding protein n=1 Tax=Actinomadura barringtoniae TaxID=1427535 RepID=A0A939P7T5_9ACTN|nr:AMP-binding protein [Actinomadura barringtoniae]MBO2447208.1 AMP-binding protein [Actinomadura barringtoniae]
MNRIFAEPKIEMRRRPDGTVLLASAVPLEPHEADLARPLYRWARDRPDAVLAAERRKGGWDELTYAQGLAHAESIGEALLDLGLGPERPLLVLSGNSLRHLLLILAGHVAGIPVVSLSTGNSLNGTYGRLRSAAEVARPGAVYAEDGVRFGPALEALRDLVPTLIVGPAALGPAGPGPDDAVPLADLMRKAPGPRLAAAREAVRPDSIARIFFTSGSTGRPKAVPNTHRMLLAVQQTMRQAWPFLSGTQLTLLDWLPWSHTFGGNHNLNMVLVNGGRLLIDDGGPTPALFQHSLRNLSETAPNVYFNVPAGFALLADALEREPHCARKFFSTVRLLFSAGAPLPERLRVRMLALADEHARHEVRFTTSWGMTETSSAVTSAHHDTTEPGAIGVPLPGMKVKLAPVSGRLELRVAGPGVMPGYLVAPMNEAAFDEEGYFRTGDAVRLAAPDDPGQGLVFEGRLTEDFKLTTGTWVRAGELRADLLAATDAFTEVVVAGSGRPGPVALAWPRRGADVSPERLAAFLATFNEGRRASRRIERIALLTEPPDHAAGELTDKGSVSQLGVLAHRADFVDRLYGDPPPPEAILPTDQMARHARHAHPGST